VKASASIIINNRNYGNFVAAAIDSALDQTYAAEVIVVDDGSDDHSDVVLQSYEDRVVALRQEHAGQAAALNRGIKIASGDIVILLDSDDLMDRDKVERLVTAFEHDSEVEWARHDMRASIDGKVVADHYYPLRRHPDPWLEVLTVGEATGTTSALAFRAGFLERIGSIPEERYPTYADWYLKVIASLLGKCATLDEVLGTRRLHEGQVTGYARADSSRAAFYLKLGEAIACDVAEQAARHGVHPDVADGSLWWQQKHHFEARKGGVVADGPAFPYLMGMLSGLFASDLPLSRRAAFAVRELALAGLPPSWFRRAWWRTHYGRTSTASKLRSAIGRD
jgi:glycosyltransferase involved in cell wall biosynthesis